MTARGLICIEDLQVGDQVWSKPEGEPDHPGDWKTVEELFVRTGRIFDLHVNGELIRTTGEHPFYVAGKGWTDAISLQEGDLLYSQDGSTVPVEKCHDTGEWETVYNCRVADYHTYFVGGDGWGWSVWSHNANYGGEVGAELSKRGLQSAADRAARTRAYNRARPELFDPAYVAPTNAGRGKMPKDVKEYIRDVEAVTGRKLTPEQIQHLKDDLKVNSYTKLSEDAAAAHRRQFNRVKDDLIADWEAKTGQQWPRYTENIPKMNGEPGFSRVKDQPYDAHHLIENELGGPAAWWNIHPARYPSEHQGGIHRAGGPLRNLLDGL